jgi:hypothetical protein
MLLKQGSDQTQKARLLAKLLRQIVTEESCDSLADVVDLLKWRCARLRIKWTNDDINDAIDLVESNRSLVPSRLPSGNPQHLERHDPAPRQLTRLDARRLIRELGLDVKPMPKAILVTPSQADQIKALKLVLEEIERTAARCDALERTPNR